MSSSAKAFDAAEALYSDGEWEKALQSFRKFETNFPMSTALCPAQYFEGWCLFNLKRHQEAVKTFAGMIKAYKDAPLVPEATLKLAECHRELKDYPTALQTYRDFQKKYPRSLFLPQAMIGEAWTFVKIKDFEAAKAIIRNLFAAYRNDPSVKMDATFILAQIFNEEKKYEEARALLRTIAASNNPRATDALFAQAETYYAMKDYEKAIDFYKRAQPTAALLSNIDSQIAELMAQRATFVSTGGDIGFVNAQIQQWQTLKKTISQREDLRPLALFRVANCYQEMKRPEEAGVVYRFLLEKFPTHKTTEFSYYGLIQSLTESRRLAEANPLTEEFRQKFPTSQLLDTTDYLQAISIFGAKRYQDALDRFVKFLSTCKSPEMKESTEYYIAACNYAMAQEDPNLYPKALSLFTAFEKNYPNSKLLPEVLFRHGRSQYEIAQRSNKSEEAHTCIADSVLQFENIRSKFPKYEFLSQVTFQLGYLYTYLAAFDRDPKTGAPTTTANYDKAIAAFETFNREWPNQTDEKGRSLNAEAYYQIARTHVAVKRFDKAIEAYKMVTENYANNDLAPYAAYEMSGSYADLKQPDKAIASLKDYIKKYPNHNKIVEALFLIADSLKAKQPEEAIKVYTDILNRTATTDDGNREVWLPQALGALRQVVTLLAQRDDIKGAIATCDKSLADFSKYPSAIRGVFAELVTLYRRAKLPAEGLAKLDELAKQYQSNTAVRIAATTSALELALANKDYPRGSEAATKLLADPEKDKLPPVTYIAIGNLFLKTDKFTEARNAFQKVLTLYANDNNAGPLAQLGLGQALIQLKDFTAAEAAFNKQMPQDPSQAAPEALLGLGQIYEEQGRNKNVKDPINIQAVQYYTIVAKSGRRDLMSVAFYRLGTLFFNVKETDSAKDKENKKIALPYFMRLLFSPEPLLEEGMFRTAQCHEALDNLPMALTAYRNYIKRYPNGKFAGEANKKIAEITPKIPAAS